MSDVIPFPVDSRSVPARIRIENAAALRRLRGSYAVARRRGMPLAARRLREINALLGGAPLPIMRKVGVL